MAGGAAMADAFIQLGDLLHKNTNQSIGVIGGLRNQQKQMEIQEDQFNRTLDANNKQNAIQNQMVKRNQGMSAIDMLANQRYAAMSRFQNQPFRDALFNAMR